MGMTSKTLYGYAVWFKGKLIFPTDDYNIYKSVKFETKEQTLKIAIEKVKEHMKLLDEMQLKSYTDDYVEKMQIKSDDYVIEIHEERDSLYGGEDIERLLEE